MKTRFNKILTAITALTFVAALTLNKQASLSNPFIGMSDEAITQSTSDITYGTTQPYAQCCLDCDNPYGHPIVGYC